MTVGELVERLQRLPKQYTIEIWDVETNQSYPAKELIDIDHTTGLVVLEVENAR